MDKMSSSPKSKQHPAWMEKLFPIVFCLAGVALLAFGSRELIDGYSSSDWQKAEGVITESRLARTGSGEKGHKPAIAYSYTVQGAQLSSDRILFGMPSFRTISKSRRQRAREWLEKYPEGRRVTVAYKPTDPGQSTLNPGAHITAWIAPLMGLPFLAAGLLMFRSCKKDKVQSHVKSSTDH